MRGWKGVSGTPIPGVVGLGEPPADDGVCGTRVVNPDGSVSSGGGLAGVDKTISGGGGAAAASFEFWGGAAQCTTSAHILAHSQAREKRAVTPAAYRV